MLFSKKTMVFNLFYGAKPNKIRIKTLFFILLISILFLIQSSMSLASPGKQGSVSQRYIVVLDEKPLLETYLDELNKSPRIRSLDALLSSKTLRTQVLDRFVKIREKQDLIINKVMQIRQKNRFLKSNAQIDTKKIKRLSRVLSALVLNLTPEELNEIKKLPYVKSVEPDTTLKLLAPKSNDSHSSLESSLNNSFNSIKLNLINGTNYTGKGIVVAVIDSGIDYTHPDLGNCTLSQILNKTCSKILDGYDFGEIDNDPWDDFGHGTHCAGIIAANGSIKGVAPDAKLLAYKVSYRDWFGNIAIPLSTVLQALERSLDPNQDLDFSDHADIVSMSLGSEFGYADDLSSKVVDDFVKAGIFVSISAGNDYDTSYIISSPSTSREAISVAAYNESSNGIASFSSSGPAPVYPYGSYPPSSNYIFKPEIAAPGVDIYSTVPSDVEKCMSYNICSSLGYAYLSGTSMAAPYISGVAALILQKAKEENVSLKPRDVKSLIIQYSKDLGEPLYRQGAGLVQPLRSLDGEITFNPPVLNFEDINTMSLSSINLTIKNVGNKEHRLYFNLSSLGSYSNYLILSENNFTIPAKQNHSILITVNPLKKPTKEIMLLMRVEDYFNTSVENLSLPVMISAFSLLSLNRNLTIKIVSDTLTCDEIRNSDLNIFLAQKEQSGFPYYQTYSSLNQVLDDNCSLTTNFDSTGDYVAVLYGSIRKNNALNYYLVPKDLSFNGSNSYILIFNLSNLTIEQVPTSLVNNSFLRRVALNLVFHNASQIYDLNNFDTIVNYESQNIYDYLIPKDNETVFFNYNSSYDLTKSSYNYNLSFELWFEWVKPRINDTLTQTILSFNNILPNIFYDIYIYKKIFLNKINDSILNLNLDNTKNYSITQKMPVDLASDYTAYRSIQYVNKYGVYRIPPIKDHLTFGFYNIFEIEPEIEASFVIVNQYGGKDRSYLKEIYGRELSTFFKGFPQYTVFLADQKLSLPFRDNVTLGLSNFSILSLKQLVNAKKEGAISNNSASFLKASSDYLLITNYDLYYLSAFQIEGENSYYPADDSLLYISDANPMYPAYPEFSFLLPYIRVGDFSIFGYKNYIYLNYTLPQLSSFSKVNHEMELSLKSNVCPIVFLDIYNLSSEKNGDLLNISFDYVLVNYSDVIGILDKDVSLDSSFTFEKNDSLIKKPLNVSCLQRDYESYSCSAVLNLSQENISSLDFYLKIIDNTCEESRQINISNFYVAKKPLFVNLSPSDYVPLNGLVYFNITTPEGRVIKDLPVKVYLSGEFRSTLISEFIAKENSMLNLSSYSGLIALTFETPENFPYESLNQTVYLYRLLNSSLISPVGKYLDNKTLLINISSEKADSCNYSLNFLDNNSISYNGSLIKNNSYWYHSINITNEGYYLLDLSCANSSEESYWFYHDTIFVDYTNPIYELFLSSNNWTAGKRVSGYININDSSPKVNFSLKLVDPYNNSVLLISGDSKLYNFSIIPYEIGNYTLYINITDLTNHSNNSKYTFYSARPENASVVINVTSNVSIIIDELNQTFNETVNKTVNATVNLTENVTKNITITIIANKTPEAKLILENLTLAELNLTLDFVKNSSQLSKQKKTLGVKTYIPKLKSKLIFNLSDLSDLSKLIVFKCNNWSILNHSCLGSWSTYDNFTLDSNKKEIYVNVISFSAYFVGPETICGDSVCEGDEDCNSCSADCGACPPQPSSSGGGASSSVSSSKTFEPTCDFSREYSFSELQNNTLLGATNLTHLVNYSISDFSKDFSKLIICINNLTLEKALDLSNDSIATLFSSDSNYSFYLYNVTIYGRTFLGKYEELKDLILNFTFVDSCEKGLCNFSIYKINNFSINKTFVYSCNKQDCLFSFVIKPDLFFIFKQSLEPKIEIINNSNETLEKGSLENQTDLLESSKKTNNFRFVELNSKEKGMPKYFSNVKYWLKYLIYEISINLAHPVFVTIITVLIIALFLLLTLTPIISKEKDAKLYLKLNEELSKFEQDLKMSNYVPSQDALLKISDLEEIIKKKNFKDLEKRLEKILNKVKFVENEN